MLALAAIALYCIPVRAQAQYYQQLGPRSLYPRVNHFTNNADFTLSMRDALDYITRGTRLLAVGPRIMGGEPAPFGAWPWVASLEFKLARRRDAHFCGGAFIAPQWVITAAHCVKPESAGAIDVLGGTNTLETGGALYPVDRVIVNEKYDTDTQDYDVALLHLSRAYQGKTVRLLTAADAERYAAVGTLAVSTGWGLTAEGAEVSNILRQVTVRIVSNQTCNGVAAYSGAVTDRMVCAGFAEGGKDSCQGDSGGPLMVPDGDGGYFQAGIVSWGEGCGRPNKFGVYTRVSTIVDWVAEKIGAKAAPVASNATTAAPETARAGPAKPKSAKPETVKPEAAKPAPTMAEPAKAEPTKPESRKTESAKATPREAGPAKPAAAETAKTAKTAKTAPARSARFDNTPATRASRARQPTLRTVPMPLPRPAALNRYRPSSQRRSERRIGAPIDRKYSPSYPARAQAHPRSRAPSKRVVPRKRLRGYYYRGHYYYESPSYRRYSIPPSFDWRRSR